MDKKGSEQDPLSRLVFSALVALALCYGAEKLLEKGSFPVLAPYLTWLKENRVPAIALLTAALYALSLFLPIEGEGGGGSPSEPCCGFTQVEL